MSGTGHGSGSGSGTGMGTGKGKGASQDDSSFSPKGTSLSPYKVTDRLGPDSLLAKGLPFKGLKPLSADARKTPVRVRERLINNKIGEIEVECVKDRVKEIEDTFTFQNKGGRDYKSERIELSNRRNGRIGDDRYSIQNKLDEKDVKSDRKLDRNGEKREDNPISPTGNGKRSTNIEPVNSPVLTPGRERLKRFNGGVVEGIALPPSLPLSPSRPLSPSHIDYAGSTLRNSQPHTHSPSASMSGQALSPSSSSPMRGGKITRPLSARVRHDSVVCDISDYYAQVNSPPDSIEFDTKVRLE